MTRRTCGLLLAALLLAPAISFADEGMWLFTKPPSKYLKDKYSFDISDKWLDHVQKSSIRFPHGSGSFVSADGLIMTNHHVGAEAIQKVGENDEKDYLKEGFHAKFRKDEKKVPGMELNVLMSIEDVTKEVNDAVKPEMKPAEAFAARRAAIAKIEKESTDKTKLKSEVVTLYQGAQYHLYRYKKYTDVRLVFAPEKAIAFFGGDPDNFEFPRYDLDITFFRVYEDGKPAKIEHYLTWSRDGATENELVFVSGHPGRTNRLNTIAELEYFRDLGYPFRLQQLYRREVLLGNYRERSSENKRKAEDLYFSVANSRKAFKGMLGGLLDPDIMAKRAAEEKKLKDAADKDEKLRDAKKAWEKVAKLQQLRKRIIRPYTMWESPAGFNSELFNFARALVRAAEEREKPNTERLREYTESALPTLKVQLLSDEKIYDDYETLRLADGLTYLCEEIGVKDPLVKKVLAGKSPQERAHELVKGSKLKDVEVRKKLYEGGKKAIDEADDTMIALAKLVDEEARKWRKQVETEFDEPRRQAYADIAKVKYAVEGDNTYPDATFTLRLAFGVVKAYEENGKRVPALTTFAGLFERSADHNNREPFELPERWRARKDKLDLKTPLNFVCTADIIGGNSGSPVLNKKGELVGIIFDGNIQSLVLDFIYTEEQGRALAVHSRGILEALSKVYEATELVDEITGKNSTGGQ
jgi:hypothetical protein